MKETQKLDIFSSFSPFVSTISFFATVIYVEERYIYYINCTEASKVQNKIDRMEADGIECFTLQF